MAYFMDQYIAEGADKLFTFPSRDTDWKVGAPTQAQIDNFYTKNLMVGNQTAFKPYGETMPAGTRDFINTFHIPLCPSGYPYDSNTGVCVKKGVQASWGCGDDFENPVNCGWTGDLPPQYTNLSAMNIDAPVTISSSHPSLVVNGQPTQWVSGSGKPVSQPWLSSSAIPDTKTLSGAGGTPQNQAVWKSGPAPIGFAN